MIAIIESVSTTPRVPASASASLTPSTTLQLLMPTGS